MTITSTYSITTQASEAIAALGPERLQTGDIGHESLRGLDRLKNFARTTLKFRGSSYAVGSTVVSTPLANSSLKFRGNQYSEYQMIPPYHRFKGLKFRGIAY